MEKLIDCLVDDPEISKLFSIDAELQSMIDVEAALAFAQKETGFIPEAHGTYLEKLYAGFKPDVAAIKQAMQRDGVPVPELVKQLRKKAEAPFDTSIHKGSTSQDIVDTALMLRLKRVFKRLEQSLSIILELLGDLVKRYGTQTYIAHTRMQIARPMTVSDKLSSWKNALLADQSRLSHAQSTFFIVQTGGAIGNNSDFGVKNRDIVRLMAEKLDLNYGNSWQTDRSRIIDIAETFCLIAGTLGKIGQDIVLMAQNEVHAIALAKSGTSSAMPHKNNPVKAEILVSIARLQAGLLGTIAQSLIHENERSGAAWSLEWLVLPQMAVTSGGALLELRQLMETMSFQEVRT